MRVDRFDSMKWVRPCQFDVIALISSRKQLYRFGRRVEPPFFLLCFVVVLGRCWTVHAHHETSQSAAAGPLIAKVFFDVRETAKCRLIDERIELCDRFCFAVLCCIESDVSSGRATVILTEFSAQIQKPRANCRGYARLEPRNTFSVVFIWSSGTNIAFGERRAATHK